jgi:hypothetical protein
MRFSSVEGCERACPGCKACDELRKKLAGGKPKPTEDVATQSEVQPTPSDEPGDVASTYHEESGEITSQAAEEKAELQRELARKEEIARNFREEQIRKAEERAMAREREEAARADAIRKAELEHDRRLIEEAKARLEKDKQISLQVARAAKDQAIRDSLTMAAIAQQAKEEIKRENTKTGLELAQLLQMAAVTMQAATAMNSLEGTNSAPIAQTFDPTQPVAPKAALAGRSPASLGDKKATISSKSDDPTEAEGANAEDEKSLKDKETLAKIKAEVEAAEKRKKILGMRLKKSLRDKLNDKLAKEQGAAAVDAEGLFDGSLRQGMAIANDSDQAEESAAKNGAMSASSVFRAVNQAVSDGFSLGGAETDREVGQIVADAERDLSSEEMSSGVLGRESPSLFQRVHSVHQACARQKCVVTLK